MDDTISRQAAIDAVRMVIGDNRSISVCNGIKQLPSAEPESIRCKDCKKREHCRTTNTWAVAPSDDWFCADAERRTDE